MTTQPGCENHPPQASDIPTIQLVTEVYASALPAVRTDMVAQLVGQVYESAPPVERGFLVRHLMQPLGILSLMAVANGVFAKIRLQGGLSGMPAQLEDVKVDDVIELANFAQQVSLQALDGLGQWLTSSPALAGSAAAAILINIFMDRAKQRRESDLQD